jgi:hypothetical protein
MNNKMRSVLRIIAVLLVLLAVLMQLDIMSIRYLDGIKFWMVVIAFCLMVVSSK